MPRPEDGQNMNTATILGLNRAKSEMPRPEDGQNMNTGTETRAQPANSAKNKSLKAAWRCKRKDDRSRGRNNRMRRGFAKNKLTRGASETPEEKGVTFPRVRGIQKMLVSTRATRIKVGLETLCRGADPSQIRSSQIKDGTGAIRATPNCSVHTRARSQSIAEHEGDSANSCMRHGNGSEELSKDLDFQFGLRKTQSAVLELRNSQTPVASGYGDGYAFSFSREFNQLQIRCPQSENPESQAINKEVVSVSEVLSEVFTSKCEVSPDGLLQNSRSVTGPLGAGLCPTGHRGSRVSPPAESPWAYLTAYSKPRLPGADDGDPRVSELKTRDRTRNRIPCGRRNTVVKVLGISNRGVVEMATMKKKKKEEMKKKGFKKKRKEMKKVKQMRILKIGQKCRSFTEATLDVNWNEGRNKPGRRENQRKGDGVKTWGGAFTKERKRRVRRVRSADNELQATNSRDPIRREATSIIIIIITTGCHQHKQYQQFYKKWREQPTALKLTPLVVVLIIPLFFVAGGWIQQRQRVWKRLFQPKGYFNVENTNSCSNLLSHPDRTSFLIALPAETVFILRLSKLSSTLMPLLSVRHQHLLKYKAECRTDVKRHYYSCFVLLPRRRGVGNNRGCCVTVCDSKLCLNRLSSWSTSSAFVVLNNVQRAKRGVRLGVTQFQQLDVLLYYPRIKFHQKRYPNKNDIKDNHAKSPGIDYHHLNQYHHLSLVARHPTGEISGPPIIKIKPVPEEGPFSKIQTHNNNKGKTFVRISKHVTTCSVRDVYNSISKNNTHPHSQSRDKVFSLLYAEKRLPPKPERSYPHLTVQLPKCYDRLNKDSHNKIIRTEGVNIILRNDGRRSGFKLYNTKNVDLYNNNKDNYSNINTGRDNSSLFTPSLFFFFSLPDLQMTKCSVVTIEHNKDELYGLVRFPLSKKTDSVRLLGNVRLSNDDSGLFRRPGLGLVVCDTTTKKKKEKEKKLKMKKTEPALYEQEGKKKGNLSQSCKYYYEIEKPRPPGNKVSYSNQTGEEEKEEEEEEEKEEERPKEEGKKKKRNAIVLPSQRGWNRRICPADEIGTPSVATAEEKLKPERTRPALHAATRLANNANLQEEGITIETTTTTAATTTSATMTYERETKSSKNDACGVQDGRRRRRWRLRAGSWMRTSSPIDGSCITVAKRESSRKPSPERGSKTLAGDILVPRSVVPEFRESKKDNQPSADAKNGSFETNTGNISTNTVGWTLSSDDHWRAGMETTSPGIPSFADRMPLPDVAQQLTKDTDNIHTIPTTYNNSDTNTTNSSDPLNYNTNDDTTMDSFFFKFNKSSLSKGNSNTVNRASNGPLKSLASERLSEKGHQSELSIKTPEKNISTENTSTPFTGLHPSTSTSLQLSSPSCPNSRSSSPPSSCSPSPLSLHHHQHNHHQKQQQHSPYQHNNNNNNNKKDVNTSYYCDYFKKFASRFLIEKRLSRMVSIWGKTFLGLLLVFQLVGTSMLTNAVPVPKKKLSNEVKGMNYLTSFGYVSGPSQEAENLMSESVKIESIKRFQSFADLPVTGIFDHRTMQMMEKPRCGNSDKPALSERADGRTKRYILSESHWRRTNLTFRFLNYTPDIDFPKIRKAIYDAFLVWSRVTHLTFTEIMFDSNNGKDADIRIQFAQRYHNDGYPFDGEGIILAHAFFPGENKGGDTHFDDDEHWTVDSDEGVNLFMVAAHEFGHALGLSHSKTPGSLMYPWYQGKQSKGYQLPQDDVNGIQKLYGEKNTNETMNIPVREFPDEGNDETSTREDDEIPHGNCTHTFDAITKIRGDVYIFKGKYFWRWTSGGLKDSKPILISHFWYLFPEESIDAVFERKRDSKIMFFKGDKYWLYDANYMERGWPLEGRPLVELGLPGDLKKIDAAFTWTYNKRTYLVSNDMYWKFDEMESYMVYDYPRAMKIWQGVPTPLDAAFQFTDNKTYFIKGKHYWEYEDQKMRVKSTSPSGNIAERWMQCPSEQKQKPKYNIAPKQPSNAGCRRATGVSGFLLWTFGYYTSRLMA